MLNPFLKYPHWARKIATAGRIVRDVAISCGVSKATVSRTFSGTTILPSDEIVAALNDWLAAHSLPLAGANGKSVREARGQ